MTSAIRRPKNIPIALSSLSETQKRALRIADNKIALNAGWDPRPIRGPAFLPGLS
jgi:hypothetical protein